MQRVPAYAKLEGDLSANKAEEWESPAMNEYVYVWGFDWAALIELFLYWHTHIRTRAIALLTSTPTPPLLQIKTRPQGHGITIWAHRLCIVRTSILCSLYCSLNYCSIVLRQHKKVVTIFKLEQSVFEAQVINFLIREIQYSYVSFHTSTYS